MRSRYSTRRSRPRATWVALVTAVIVCAVTVVGVLLPVLGLLAAGTATTFGVILLPGASITAGIVISYVVALALLVVTFRSRFGALAWIAAVAAVIATGVGSVWPLFATALASVARVQDAIPFVQELIGRIAGQH